MGVFDIHYIIEYYSDDGDKEKMEMVDHDDLFVRLQDAKNKELKIVVSILGKCLLDWS